MNILWLEDRGSSVDALKKTISQRGFTIYKALDVLNAIAYWTQDRENINVIIIDLNVNSEGLKSEEIDLTRGGVLSGWIWLTKHVINDIDNNNIPTIIIYSNYIDELERYIPREEINALVNKLSIKIISKTDDADGWEKIINVLEQSKMQKK